MERADSLVKTKDPQMQKRKADGAILLLQYLEQEHRAIKDERKNELTKEREKRFEISIPNEWRNGVIAWYKRMEAHTVVSLLTEIGTSLFLHRKEYIHQLCQYNIFPLNIIHRWKKLNFKIRIANIHPLLLVWLIHLKNR